MRDMTTAMNAYKIYEMFGHWPIGELIGISLRCELCHSKVFFQIEERHSEEYTDDSGNPARDWAYSLTCARCGLIQIETGTTIMLFTNKNICEQWKTKDDQ
jgi:hypothetical protein